MIQSESFRKQLVLYYFYWSTARTFDYYYLSKLHSVYNGTIIFFNLSFYDKQL